MRTNATSYPTSFSCVAVLLVAWVVVPVSNHLCDDAHRGVAPIYDRDHHEVAVSNASSLGRRHGLVRLEGHGKDHARKDNRRGQRQKGADPGSVFPSFLEYRPKEYLHAQ
jgi:hypothetical protein